MVDIQGAQLKSYTTYLAELAASTTPITGIPVLDDGAVTRLEVGFTPNVSATDRFGMLNGGGIFLHENKSTVPTDKVGLALRTQSEFTYTGGTPGDVVTTQWNHATVSAGVADFVWAGIDILDNSATAGENVARYAQAKKRSTGPTWAGCFELQDFDDTAGGVPAVEIGLWGNGVVNTANRVGLDVVFRKRDPAGAAVGIGYGVRVTGITGEAAVSNGFFVGGAVTAGYVVAGAGTNGFHFANTASYTVGLNTSLAPSMVAAIRLAAEQKIQLEATGTITIGYEASGTKFALKNGATERLAVHSGTGAVSINSSQVLAARKTGWSVDTGTAKRTANATYSGTAEVGYTQATIQTLMDAVRDLSQTVKALKDDLHATAGHGLIGA